MPQVGIFNNQQQFYGVNPTFSGMTLLNTARNLKSYWYFDDFFENGVTAPNIWGAATAGVGAVYAKTNVTAVRPGIISVGTGTTAAGTCGIFSDPLGILFGAGQFTVETEIYLYDLSTAIEEYAFYFGFGDVLTGDQVDGAYLKYDRTASLNWLACTADNSVRTATDTGIPVVAGAWLKLKVVVNALGAAVTYYLNDILIGTVITNIPTGGGRNTGTLWNMVKSVGVTARNFLIDWAWLHVDLSVSR